MALEIGLMIGAIFVLVLLSAFFNGSETALTGVSRARMHALEQEGNEKAKGVNRLLARPEKMIGAVLLGNTLVDILAASLATTLGVALAGPAGVLYATGIMTLVIVIFAAVLPKTYAITSSDRVALVVAPIMRVVVVVLTPFTTTIEWLVRLILKLTPSKLDDAANILAAQEQLRGTIDLSHKEGAVARGDAHMLDGVLDLTELQVSDIMVHRTKMATVNAGDEPRKVVEQIVKIPHTRVPLWKDEPDNIVGVLHTKDLLRVLAERAWDANGLDIMSLAVAPWFVPDTTSLKDQLNNFLHRKSQLALVVDEYGEVQGLITLEDIVEEIVGQITDEHETAVPIRPQADGTVIVDGTVPVRDLNRHMDWDLPDEEATTVAGLVIHEAQTIPEPGQAFTFYGYRFGVMRKSRNKITAVRIGPPKAAGAVAAARQVTAPVMTG